MKFWIERIVHLCEIMPIARPGADTVCWSFEDPPNCDDCMIYREYKERVSQSKEEGEME